MKNGFDIVTVGIQNEGREISRMVRALAGAAVVFSAGHQGRTVKLLDGRAIGNLKSQVNVGELLLAFDLTDVEFIRIKELFAAHDFTTDRCQCLPVKGAAFFQIGNDDVNVVYKAAAVKFHARHQTPWGIAYAILNQMRRILFHLISVISLCLFIGQTSAETCQNAVTADNAAFPLDDSNPVDPFDPGLVMSTIGGDRTARAISGLLKAVESQVPVTQFSMKSQWIRDWFPLLMVQDGRLKQVVFRPSKQNVKNDSAHQAWWNSEMGIPTENVNVVLDIGNFVSDGRTAFVTKSGAFLKDNAMIFGIDEGAVAEKIKAATGIDVVYVPEVPGIPPHSDLYMAYAGNGRFVVSASRDPRQQKVLNEVAEIVGKYGQVERLLNPGWNQSSSPVYLTYAQAVIVKNKAIIPGYAAEAKHWLTQHDLGFPNGSLDVGIKIFEEDDKNAVEAYKKLGFEVVQVQMGKAPELLGMLHCMFRALPKNVVELLPEKIRELWIRSPRRGPAPL